MSLITITKKKDNKNCQKYLKSFKKSIDKHCFFINKNKFLQFKISVFKLISHSVFFTLIFKKKFKCRKFQISFCLNY